VFIAACERLFRVLPAKESMSECSAADLAEGDFQLGEAHNSSGSSTTAARSYIFCINGLSSFYFAACLWIMAVVKSQVNEATRQIAVVPRAFYFVVVK
jgi:hypothetical protein